MGGTINIGFGLNGGWIETNFLGTITNAGIQTVNTTATTYVNVSQAGGKSMAALGDIPITTVNGATVFVRDVAQVRDGYQPQTNIVRRDGERGLLMTVLKNGGASTLDIIDAIRRELPKAVLALPPARESAAEADELALLERYAAIEQLRAGGTSPRSLVDA